MKCYRKNGSDVMFALEAVHQLPPSMKCYRKNGSDPVSRQGRRPDHPSMKCYRKNGSDTSRPRAVFRLRVSLNEVLPKER